MMNRTTPGCVRRWLLIDVAVMLFAAGGLPAQGALFNGSFEAGYSDWETKGNTSIETDSFGTGPTNGMLQALMTTRPTPDELPTGLPSEPDSVIEEFLGILPGTLDSLSGNEAVEGSAIKQTFMAAAGEILSFKWNFLTDETLLGGEGSNDFSFWTLVGIHDGEVLANTFASLAESDTVFDTETGFNTTEFEVLTTGTYTLGFGVMDVDNRNINSGLVIDDVRLLSPVPELSSVAVWTLFGVCVVVGRAHRLRHKRLRANEFTDGIDKRTETPS